MQLGRCAKGSRPLSDEKTLETLMGDLSVSREAGGTLLHTQASHTGTRLVLDSTVTC